MNDSRRKKRSSMAAGGTTGQRVDVRYFNLCAEEGRRTSSPYAVERAALSKTSDELTSWGEGCAAQEASWTARVN